MKYKIYSDRDIKRLLTKNGYTLSRQTGTHQIWTKPGHNPITIPRSCNPMIIRRLIKENGLEE